MKLELFSFKTVLSNICAGGRPNLDGIHLTPDQYAQIFHAVDSQTDSSNVLESIAYVRDLATRIIDKPNKTMQKEIKVDRPESDVPEPTKGDLVESKHTRNIYLVLEEYNNAYEVVTLYVDGAIDSRSGRQQTIQKADVKPFIGEVTITQRP